MDNPESREVSGRGSPMPSRPKQRSGKFTLSIAMSLSLSTVALFSGSGIAIKPGQLAPSHVPTAAMTVAGNPLVSSSGARVIPHGLGEESAPQLLSVRLVPEGVSLWGARAGQRFLVMGKYTDGLERDVTRQSRFSISDDQIARVDEGGRVVALADGEAVLGAEVAEQMTKTVIRVEGSEQTRPFSFGQDIGGIFTKHGCNTSDCHGSVKGKGGLKLSLNALYPKDDYQWIVEGGVYQVMTAESGGPKEPRINLEEPEKSLLLLKPTFSVPHGGGRRFTVDSADYEAILSWVGAGAPYGEEGEGQSVEIERLEIFPREGVLEPEGTQQLLVTGYLSNGRREDITEQVLYVTNNPEVVKVTPEGLVKAVKTGETAVMVRAAGKAISAGFGVIAQPIADYPEVPRKNFIDEHVFAKLRRFNIIPSPLSSDEEFLRRVCLDMTGTLPPPERVREFLSSEDPQKRQKVIETFLDSPEYVDYWAFRFADLFRVSYENGASGNSHLYWQWIRENVARNRPFDRVARERISAQGYGGPALHYYNGSELRRPSDVMAEQFRVFLGRRLDCAQCHNHPYETWSQDQFWWLTAFFGRITQLGDLGGGGPPTIIDDPAGHGMDGKGEKVTHPRTKEEVKPRFLDGELLPESEMGHLRWKLAEWMTAHPYFAEAVVNRMWGYFFGRGIVDPVDDFRLTNPPTHPELLKALAEDFRAHGHDSKHLIRLIVQSRTYQLSSVPNETNRDDQINYSRALPRPLDAEVLLDAISEVTRVPEEFVKGESNGWPLPVGLRALNLVRPDEFPSRFLDMYGRPDRQMVPERKVEASLAQALHMLAGPTYTAKLSKAGGRLDRLLKSGASDRQIIKELSLAARSRFPTAEELAALEEMIRRRPSRREAVEDLMWGLITSREFAYNH